MLEGLTLFIEEGLPTPVFWFLLNLTKYISLYFLVRFLGFSPKKGYGHYIFLAVTLTAGSILVALTAQIHGWRNVYTLCISPVFVNTAVANAIEGKNKVLTTWLASIMESLTLFTSLTTALFSGHLPMFYENKMPLLTTELGTLIMVFALFFYFTYSRKTILLDVQKLKLQHLVIILICLVGAEFAGGAFHAFSGVKQDDFQIRAVTSGYSMMVVFITTLLVKFLSENTEKHHYIEQARVNETLAEKQRQYYALLLDKEMETKKFRHDINNHFACIDYLLKNESYEKAIQYMGDVSNRAGNLSPALETGNEIINAVITDLFHQFESVNFKINWRGHFPAELNTSSADLCIIFANALTNAIEAIEKIKSSVTEIIDVVIKTVGTNLYVCIQNPCAKSSRANGRRPGTDKLDKSSHGFGTQNMTECIERYGGSVCFTRDTNSFTVKMIFHGILDTCQENDNSDQDESVFAQ